jgi:hypothetical protein
MTEELKETAFGRGLGYPEEAVKELFELVKDPHDRVEIITRAHKNNVPLSIINRNLRKRKGLE